MSQRPTAQQRRTVLMVTDFFYPNFGGVENHVYQLSQCLLQQGYKVVVVTHAYGDCAGVRYLTNGLKVYYLYRRPLYLQSTAPTVLGSMRILRVILLRERATIVHAHQAFSTLGLEACLHARTMGYKVVFTDHSLFGLADLSSILMNQLLMCVLSDVHHVICVSHTSKENTVLRASLRTSSVSVIPNAVNAADFMPAPPANPRPKDGLHDRVVVVALSRLVYRKGIDLMALVIPYICSVHPNVDFIIGGGGPKSALLEAMIADHGLEGRVLLQGPIPNEKARDFLLQGHIFLNASLTEAFCIAIVEAAACGLLVVSTCVGGVPEVLPPDMTELSEPSAEGLCAALQRALGRVGAVQPMKQHERVADMYSWPDVAMRTAAVYDTVIAEEDSACSWCLQNQAVQGKDSQHLALYSGVVQQHTSRDFPQPHLLQQQQQQQQSTQDSSARHLHRSGCPQDALLSGAGNRVEHVGVLWPTPGDGCLGGGVSLDVGHVHWRTGAAEAPTKACNATAENGCCGLPSDLQGGHCAPAASEPHHKDWQGASPQLGCSDCLQGVHATYVPCSCCQCSHRHSCSEAAAYCQAVQGGELLSRLACYYQRGPVAGLLYGALALIVHIWWCFLQWLQPAHKIQPALDFPSQTTPSMHSQHTWW